MNVLLIGYRGQLGQELARQRVYYPIQMILAEIDELETTEIQVEHFTRYGERFPPILGAGLVLLLLEIGLGQTALRKLP